VPLFIVHNVLVKTKTRPDRMLDWMPDQQVL